MPVMSLRFHMSPVVVAALALAVVPASGAADTTTPAVAQSKLLWATVNVCDTPDHPATIGVRASIPGDGVAAEEMFVRFQAQYLAADGTWHTVARGADSGFVSLGSDLTLSSTPAYDWYVLSLDGTGGPVDSGEFALWNAKEGDYLVYDHQIWGVSLNW